MKCFALFFFFLIFVLSSITCYAQDSTHEASWLSRHPVEFSLGTHSIGLPFNNFLSPPYYPEVNIGLQSDLINQRNLNLNMVNGLGFASHSFIGSRHSINTFLRVKYQFPLNIYGQIGLGASFTILTYPNAVYELNDKGKYEEQNSLETKWYGGFTMEIGYRLRSYGTLDLDIFSKYNAGVNFRHHPQIPVFPYNSTHIGIRVYIKKGNSI